MKEANTFYDEFNSELQNIPQILLNFDYIPLGSFVNFFSQASTYKFLNL